MQQGVRKLQAILSRAAGSDEQSDELGIAEGDGAAGEQLLARGGLNDGGGIWHAQEFPPTCPLKPSDLSGVFDDNQDVFDPGDGPFGGSALPVCPASTARRSSMVSASLAGLSGLRRAIRGKRIAMPDLWRVDAAMPS